MTRDQATTRLLKSILFCAALAPFAWLVADALADRLGANPIEEITFRTGDWALRLLLVTLAVTPLRRLTGWHAVARARRMLGLFAFFYASLHLTTYVWLDQYFAWRDIVEDILKRPYITIGLTGFSLLLPLAITSTHSMARRLGGRRWRKLHSLVYVAAVAGALHYLWLVKADTREPLIYLTILLVLLVLRLPALRRRAPLAGRGRKQRRQVRVVADRRDLSPGTSHHPSRKPQTEGLLEDT